MSHTNKLIIVAIVSALAGAVAGGAYIFQINKSPEPSPTTLSESKITTGNSEWEELIKHNCELSGGSFANNVCTCVIEEENGQTQEMMYDKSTGYCQSTHGGPAGDAFNASIGLPYGGYSHWSQIVLGICADSGGSVSGAACICPEDKAYSKVSGKCE